MAAIEFQGVSKVYPDGTRAVMFMDRQYGTDETTGLSDVTLVIGDEQYAFAIEERVGAHVFSLTFSNGAGTTFRQIAHGGVPGRLNLGFNLTRKFY